VITVEDLRQELSAFDGKALTVLGEIEARHDTEPGYRNALTSLASAQEPAIACGATWLIKHYLENDGLLTLYQIDQLLSATPAMKDWKAQLHLCQSIRYLDLSDEETIILIPWLDLLMSHPRPFLRAWALDALWRITRQHPVFAHIGIVALEAAEADTAPSVQARLRTIRKGETL